MNLSDVYRCVSQSQLSGAEGSGAGCYGAEACRTSSSLTFSLPVLSAHPNQPFRLELLRHSLQLMQDPDIGLVDMAESGFHTECLNQSGSLASGAAKRPKSVEEDPDIVSRLTQKMSTPSSCRSSKGCGSGSPPRRQVYRSLDSGKGDLA